jgi:hypothetical protein
MSTTTTAMDLASALTAARAEGRAWGAELIDNCRGDAREAAAGPRRDPSGWYTGCAFTTVRDAVSPEVWAEHEDVLVRACADEAARVVIAAAAATEAVDG